MNAPPSKKRKVWHSQSKKPLSLDDDQSNEKQNEIIKLNVGGVHFVTFRSPLLTIKGSYFSHRFGGRFRAGPKLDGRFFVDRNGERFGVILEYLRNGNKVVLPNDVSDLQALKLEAKFYCLPTLVQLIRLAIRDKSHVLTNDQKLSAHLATRIGKLSQILNALADSRGFALCGSFEDDSEIEFDLDDYDE